MKIGTPASASAAASPALSSGSKGGVLKGALRKSIGGSGGHIRLDMGANIVAGLIATFVCGNVCASNSCFLFFFEQNSTRQRPLAVSKKPGRTRVRSSRRSCNTRVMSALASAVLPRKIIFLLLPTCSKHYDNLICSRVTRRH